MARRKKRNRSNDFMRISRITQIGAVLLVGYIMATDFRDKMPIGGAQVKLPSEWDDGIISITSNNGNKNNLTGELKNLSAKLYDSARIGKIVEHKEGAGAEAVCGSEVNFRFKSIGKDNKILEESGEGGKTVILGSGEGLIKIIERNLDGMKEGGGKTITLTAGLIYAVSSPASLDKNNQETEEMQNTVQASYQNLPPSESVKIEISLDKVKNPRSDDLLFRKIIEKDGSSISALCGDTVTVEYKAFTSDGKPFSRSDTPISFRIGDNKVAQGVSLGIRKMRMGEKALLIIPSGATGNNPDQSIIKLPKNQVVHLEITLLKIM